MAHLTPQPQRAAGLLPGASRQAILIDCCTARQQQARPLFDPYPQQHGGQLQTRAVPRCQLTHEAERGLVSDKTVAQSARVRENRQTRLSSVTSSLFHSRLKTFLFCKSLPP